MEPLLAIALFAVIIIVRYLYINKGNKHPFRSYIYNRVIYNNPINADDYSRINKLLEEKVDYYKHLSDPQRARFIRRIYDFREQTKFVGMEGLAVTEEMELIISAGAVQLTFWLKHYALDFIKRIHIYPEVFYHKGINRRIKGGAVPNGVIMFSWRDILKGYSDPHDKINLALHEMAHALKLSAFHGEEFDTKFHGYIDNWLDISQEEYIKIQSGQYSVLRKYAGVNMHEFFAVSVEHFFEAPKEFSEHLPDVYNHLCVLLNQNPLNQKADYVYDIAFARQVNAESARIPVPFWKKAG